MTHTRSLCRRDLTALSFRATPGRLDLELTQNGLHYALEQLGDAWTGGRVLVPEDVVLFLLDEQLTTTYWYPNTIFTGA